MGGRLRALDARAQLTTDPTWKALLFIDLAELAAASGDTPRAYDALGSAAALEGRAQFRTQVVLEQVAAKEDKPRRADPRPRGAGVPHRGGHRGRRSAATPAGVPRYMRRPGVRAADAWPRAAGIKRRQGDGPGAAALPRSRRAAPPRVGRHRARPARRARSRGRRGRRGRHRQAPAGAGRRRPGRRRALAPPRRGRGGRLRSRRRHLRAPETRSSSDKTSVLARNPGDRSPRRSARIRRRSPASYESMAETLGEGGPPAPGAARPPRRGVHLGRAGGRPRRRAHRAGSGGQTGRSGDGAGACRPVHRRIAR